MRARIRCTSCSDRSARNRPAQFLRSAATTPFNGINRSSAFACITTLVPKRTATYYTMRQAEWSDSIRARRGDSKPGERGDRKKTKGRTGDAGARGEVSEFKTFSKG